MLTIVFTGAYYSFLWQAPFILLFGSYARPGERNAEIIWLYMVSVLTCVIYRVLCRPPAEPGVLGMKHIDELRDPQRSLDPDERQWRRHCDLPVRARGARSHLHLRAPAIAWWALLAWRR
jgi:hypothetical protein